MAEHISMGMVCYSQKEIQLKHFTHFILFVQYLCTDLSTYLHIHLPSCFFSNFSKVLQQIFFSFFHNFPFVYRIIKSICIFKRIRLYNANKKYNWNSNSYLIPSLSQFLWMNEWRRKKNTKALETCFPHSPSHG